MDRLDTTHAANVGNAKEKTTRLFYQIRGDCMMPLILFITSLSVSIASFAVLLILTDREG